MSVRLIGLLGLILLLSACGGSPYGRYGRDPYYGSSRGVNQRGVYQDRRVYREDSNRNYRFERERQRREAQQRRRELRQERKEERRRSFGR